MYAQFAIPLKTDCLPLVAPREVCKRHDGASSMSPDLRAIVVNRLRTPNGQAWAEVRVALRFNDLLEPPPSMIVRFPYSASEELNSAPEELTELILKVAGDRLIQLFKDAAAELEQKPLEYRSPYVVLGPPSAR
jgi:hypothetical protein